jgi:hypothetical protein
MQIKNTDNEYFNYYKKLSFDSESESHIFICPCKGKIQIHDNFFTLITTTFASFSGQAVSPTKVGITIHVLSISKVDDFNQVQQQQQH